MRPSDGGQSMRMKSKSSTTVSMARFSLSSRLKAGTSSISMPARSMVAGATKRFLTLVGSMQSSRGWSCMMTSYMESSKFRASMPSPVVALPWGSRSIDQHPIAQLGQSRAQVDRGRGLAHAALLVGDGDDPGQFLGPASCHSADRWHGAPMEGARMACLGPAGAAEGRSSCWGAAGSDGVVTVFGSVAAGGVESGPGGRSTPSGISAPAGTPAPAGTSAPSGTSTLTPTGT